MGETKRDLKRLRRDPERRERLRDRLDRYLDLPLAVASILLVLLTVVELTGEVSPRWRPVVSWLFLALWALFVFEFAAKLVLSPDRTRYLRRNWLDALVVVLPVLRIFKALAVLRLTRAASVFRLLIFGGRSSSAVIQLLQRRRLGQLTLISVLITLIAAALAYLLESGAPGATIRTFGDALWWSAGTLTTVATELYPVTVGGRLLGIGLMIYAMVFFTYLAATIASVFIGIDVREPPETEPERQVRRD